MGVVWTFFSLDYHFSFLSPSLWGTARYRLKYCLKGPLSPKHPTNQLSVRLQLYQYSLTANYATLNCQCQFAWSKVFVVILTAISFVIYSMAIFPLNRRGGRVVRWCWVNFQCRGVLLIWIRVGQGPTALAVGAGGGCLDVFYSHLSFLFSFSLSLGDGPI